MYNIGDVIVYGSVGVMRIVDVREMTLSDISRSYYVLKEYGTSSVSETLVPIDNEQLSSQMYPLLSREELIEAIRRSKNMPEAEWTENNRTRAEKFKEILSSGNRTELVSMIRSIYRAGERRGEVGKKNFLSDETAMRKAEKLLHSEVSIVMDIPIGDVPAFIEQL